MSFTPGQPYDAPSVLSIMRGSRRPGGVPDVIETEPVAAAVADSIWTIDGARWDEVLVGGSCGSALCTLDIVGVRDDAQGEDLWTFSIDASSGSVAVVDVQSGAVPNDLAALIDERTRLLAPRRLLDGMILASVRWTAPPSAAGYVLAYRTGDEEASCAIDVRLSGDGRRLEDVTSTGC